MNVLVTGAKGFIGKNLCLELCNRQFRVFEFDKDNSIEDLQNYVAKADFIIHIAGINRPLTKEEFYDGNSNFTLRLTDIVKKVGKRIPIIFSSSIQADLDNDYGKSKKKAEDYLLNFSKETGIPVYIYHLSNVFGKWCRPNYNSVIATFCFNVSHNLEIKVSNPENEVAFVYIDDVVNDFIDLIMEKKINCHIFPLEVLPIYKVKLGKISGLITSFKESRTNLYIPLMDNGFDTKLYSTYLSYLDSKDFAYPLVSHSDTRGSFTEFFKTLDSGQLSINTTKPGITKGNHWHHTKTEKFLVVSGEGVIRFRKVNSDVLIEYKVSGNELRVVDIPCGYTHSISNVGENDLITVMWASESFNPNKPDTYPMEVIKK